MRLYKRLHVLHPITLLEAAKGKGWLFCLINPTYSMTDEDQVLRAAAKEAIAEQLNPPAVAAVQPAAEVQPTAEIQPAVQANEARHRTRC